MTQYRLKRRDKLDGYYRCCDACQVKTDRTTDLSEWRRCRCDYQDADCLYPLTHSRQFILCEKCLELSTIPVASGFIKNKWGTNALGIPLPSILGKK